MPDSDTCSLTGNTNLNAFHMHLNYLKFVALSEQSQQPFATVAELDGVEAGIAN